MSFISNIESLITSILTNKNHCYNEDHYHHKPHSDPHDLHKKPITWLQIEFQTTKFKTNGDFYMDITLKDSEFVNLHAHAHDAIGAEVDGNVAYNWTSSDESVITLDVSEGGHTAKATTTGKLGTVTVTVAVGDKTGVFNITVIAGDVVSVDVSADTPASRLTDTTPTPAPAPAPAVDNTVQPTDATPTA
jgi:hypothetical protein